MRKQRSIGEMISTVTFFGLSAYLLIFSLGLLEENEKLRGAIGLLAATCCGLGGPSQADRLGHALRRTRANGERLPRLAAQSGGAHQRGQDAGHAWLPGAAPHRPEGHAAATFPRAAHCL